VVPQRDDALAVGSGPYVVERHDGNVVRMVANERYWRGRPDFDALEFEVFDDGDALVDAIARGDLDAVSLVPPRLFEELNGTENVTTIFGNDGDYYALAVDTRRAPFDDARVRRALWLAIDRALLIERVASGVGHAAEVPTVARSTVWGFEEKTRLRLAQQLTNDPARARQLLRDAGVDRAPLSIAVPPDDAAARDTANGLVELLRGTAFEATIAKGDALSASVRIVRRAPGDDPDAMLAAFTCSAENGQWCDPAYDRRYAAQATDLDPVSRLETVRELQRMLIAEAPEVPLFHPDLLEGYRGDRWRDLVRQPDETGPAFFTASAANFRSVEQMAPGSDEVSAVVVLVVVVVIVGVALGATALYFFVRARATRQSASTPAPTAS
jgi:ABC-type transport system substrate-binding protein